jgi:hypothetical protein
MSRKSNAAVKEPASLPDVPLPLSEVPESQRAAYELEVIDDPEMFRKVLSTEDFFQMLASFPAAWWGDRLSMYLYRHESDDGIMVKNPVGDGNYIKPVIRQAVDRDWIANRNGGGKYCLWLNLSSPNPANSDRRISTTVRKYTFRIDGPPLVKEGQIVEFGGKPVSVGAAAPATSVPGQPSEAAQLMETSKHATESAMGILAHASETAIDMVKEQAKTAAAPAPSNPIQDKLMEAIIAKAFAAPVAPAANPMQDKIMEMMVERAFGPRAETERPEKEETKLEEVDSIVHVLTGKNLADFARGAKPAPSVSESPWYAPLVNAAVGFGSNLLERWPAIIAAQNERLRLEIHLRSMGQPGQPQLAPPPPPPPGPTIVQRQPPANPPIIQQQQTPGQPPQPPDQGQVMNAIVQMVVAGFQQHQPIGTWGKETASAIDFHFGELIDSMGIGSFLADEAQVKEFIAGHPELNQLSKTDARFFTMFLPDFLEYTEERWGALQVGAEVVEDQSQKVEAQPVA